MGNLGSGRKRVLVTGHRGYIGCRLVPLLEAAGYHVTGIDVDYYRECSFGSGNVPAQGLTLDIRDLTPSLLEGHEAVIHLAGLSNDPLGDLDPELTHDINMLATIRLAEMAKYAGVQRFVFSSSCSNYGAAGEDWLNEESPLKPVTPYAISKMQSEEALDKLSDAHFSTTYMRSGTAYGMSPRIRFDLVVNNLTAWAIATGEVRLKSDGSAWRPLVHAEDMAQAFVCAISADRALVDRQAFNVGRNEDCVQVSYVAAKVEAAIPSARIVFSPEKIVDKRTYRVDCSKIASIGFAPRWTLERGIAELRDAFIQSGVNVGDFEGARYQRVAHIRHLIGSGMLTSSLRRAAKVKAA